MKKTLIIVVMGLIILGLGGYIAYEKFNVNEPNKNELKDGEKEEAKEEVENDDSKVEEQENLNEVATQLQKIVEESDVLSIIDEDYSEASFTKSDLENNKNYLLSKLIWNLSYEKNGNLGPDNNGIYITKDELINYTKKYFGIDSLDFQDLYLEDDYKESLGIHFKYDTNKKSYVEYKTDNKEEINEFYSIFGYSPMYTKIYNIEKNNNEYVLTLTGIYTDGADCGMYIFDRKCEIELEDSFYEKNENLGLGSEAMNKLVIDDYEKNYEKNKGKYLKSQFTFKKDKNGKFYMASFKEVK